MNRKVASMIAGWVSLASNLCLTLLKVAVGLGFGSQALFADGVHNGADVVASVASLGSMRVSNRPADEEHPYGHGNAEVIASGTVGIVLTISAAWILVKAVHSLMQPTLDVGVGVFPVAAAVLSLVWKQVLYLYTIRVGRRYSSKGLIATAYDHLSDVYASFATVVGTGVAMLGRSLGHPLWVYADPAAGIAVALLILRIAYGMGREAIDSLMEKNVSDEKLDLYHEKIMNVEYVKRIDKLRARELGHYILLDVRCSVPGELSIQQGHDISRSIKSSVMAADKNVEEVLVHLNPWYELDEGGVEKK